MKLKNSQVIVTGASRGIGEALATELKNRGAIVHNVSRSGNWSVDLSNESATQEFAQEFLEKYGPPDILINNAGQLTGGLFEKQELKDIERMMQVNLMSVIRLTHLFLPAMLKKGSGKIVNNASVSGYMYFPCASTYAASKAGVVALTESLKQELRGTGVSTLLLVTPGVKTKMYDDISGLYGEHLDLSFLTSIPASKWASQIASAIENDRDQLLPSGAMRWGLRTAKHLNPVFEWVVKGRFRR